MTRTTPACSHNFVDGLFGGGRSGVIDLFLWRWDGRCRMALSHFLLIDAGDGFFEEGGT